VWHHLVLQLHQCSYETCCLHFQAAGSYNNHNALSDTWLYISEDSNLNIQAWHVHKDMYRTHSRTKFDVAHNQQTTVKSSWADSYWFQNYNTCRCGTLKAADVKTLTNGVIRPWQLLIIGPYQLCTSDHNNHLYQNPDISWYWALMAADTDNSWCHGISTAVIRPRQPLISELWWWRLELVSEMFVYLNHLT